MEDGSSSLTVMPLDLLREITNDFSEERELGRGSFGKVYLGVHPDGEMIAVKKLYDMPGLDDKQFLNEFKNLTRLKHQNIVRLVGYCHDIQVEQVKHEGKLVLAEKTHRALCLEYMSKGSLDKYLSDECDRYDWRTCYRIIRGICQGLKYLHNELVYHFDLKPANVLLDENMDPRIADFGTSRLFSDGQTRCTQSLLGTLGYLPPEFIRSNFISNKFDIFSLGVVIIKMMAGRPGYSKSAEMPSEEFTNLIQENWTNRLLETPNRRNAYSEQIKMCIEIGLSCVQEDRHERPTIQDIVYRLEETETKCTDAARKDWLSIFQANRNTPPQYAQDPNDRPAEQIHHGPTFHTFIIPATHSNCLEESPDADVPNSTLKVNNWKIAAYKKFEERENSGGLVPDYLMRNGQPVRAVLLNDEAGPSEQARTAWEYPNDMAAQHGASLTGQQNEYLSSLTTDALGTSSPVTAVERGQHHPPAPQNETPYYLSQRNVLNSQGPISGQPTIPSHILLPVPEDDLLTGASLTGYQNGHLSTLMDAPGTSCPVTAAEFAKRILVSNQKEEKLETEKDRSRRSTDRSSQRDKIRNDEDGARISDERREKMHDRQDKPKSENKKIVDAKQLIDMIPRTKEELFSYDINWAIYEKHELHDRMRPWISKKIIEFLGEEESTLVEYIVSCTKDHVHASKMLELLQSILDVEAEMFVLKMWRMLIFEIKKVEAGLSGRGKA